jgi:TRAP-type C4-dicarboxylate transport system permease small subunit
VDVLAALRVLDALNRAIYYLLGALLAAIAVVVFIQVLVRFVLTHMGVNVSAPWTEELARFLLVWLVFLGAAIGCRRMQLISLDFVVKAVPGIAGRMLRYLALGLCLWLFVLMIHHGSQFVTIIGRTEMSPVMQVSKAWVYWAMPVAGVLMFVNTCAFALEALLDGRDIRDAATLADTD